MSQAELAQRVRLSPRTVQEVESRPAANPTLDTLDRLAEGLRLRLHELIERLDEDEGQES